MNEINSFTFYRDYYNLIDTLPIKDKQMLFTAILDYVFKDIEPNLAGHNLAIFNTLKRQITKSKNKSKSAKKDNQNEIKSKSNQNQNEINWGNKTSVLSFKFYILSFKFYKNRELLVNKILEWLEYKQQKNDYFEELSLKSLLVQIGKMVSQYGEEALINLINECMANQYKGLVFEKLNKQKPQEIKPDWFDKDIEENTATEEQIEAFNENLKKVR